MCPFVEARSRLRQLGRYLCSSKKESLVFASCSLIQLVGAATYSKTTSHLYLGAWEQSALQSSLSASTSAFSGSVYVTRPLSPDLSLRACLRILLLLSHYIVPRRVCPRASLLARTAGRTITLGVSGVVRRHSPSSKKQRPWSFRSARPRSSPWPASCLRLRETALATSKAGLSGFAGVPVSVSAYVGSGTPRLEYRPCHLVYRAIWQLYRPSSLTLRLVYRQRLPAWRYRLLPVAVY